MCGAGVCVCGCVCGGGPPGDRPLVRVEGDFQAAGTHSGSVWSVKVRVLQASIPKGGWGDATKSSVTGTQGSKESPTLPKERETETESQREPSTLCSVLRAPLLPPWGQWQELRDGPGILGKTSLSLPQAPQVTTLKPSGFIPWSLPACQRHRKTADPRLGGLSRTLIPRQLWARFPPLRPPQCPPCTPSPAQPSLPLHCLLHPNPSLPRGLRLPEPSPGKRPSPYSVLSALLPAAGVGVSLPLEATFKVLTSPHPALNLTSLDLPPCPLSSFHWDFSSCAQSSPRAVPVITEVILMSIWLSLQLPNLRLLDLLCSGILP